MAKQTPFGTMLRELRKERNLSQFELAVKYGMLQGKEYGATTSIITQMENGIRRPSHSSLDVIAQALGLADKEKNELLLAAGLLPAAEEATDREKFLKLAISRFDNVPDALEELVLDVLSNAGQIDSNDVNAARKKLRL